MAGIFALTTGTAADGRQGNAEALAAAMRLFPWQRSLLLPVPEHELVLGVVVNDEAHLEDGVFRRVEGGIACVVEGYFARTLQSCGADAEISRGHYARAAIEAYRKFGGEFPAALEGPFTVLLHDADRNRLLAANGRMASTIIYRHQEGRRVRYATQLGPLARNGGFAARPDARVISNLIAHGGAFGGETLVEEVEALRPATVASHDLATGERKERVYWSLGDLGEHGHDRPFSFHFSAVCDALTAAARRITSRPGRYISGLSGGLDSRIVTGLAATQRPDLKSWTFGSPGAPDLVVAREISERLGIEHLTYSTDPSLIPAASDLYAATVDSLISTDFAYGLPRAESLRAQGDIVLNGFAGEVVLGDYVVGPRPKVMYDNIRRGRWRGPDAVSARLSANRSNEDLAAYFAVGARNSRLKHCLAVPPTPLRERILAELEASTDVPLPFRGEHFFLVNRVSRWTVMGIVSDRHFYSDGSLFYDYEVIERAMVPPPRLRESNRMYSAVLRALVPELGAIVNANNGLRADVGPRRLFWHKVTRGIVKKLGRRPAATQVTGSDPDSWLRTVYPDHYRDLLADARTRHRSFWDAPELARTLEQHLAGELNAGAEFGQVAAVEYFCRRWLD